MKKVTFISDTHRQHYQIELPGGDFLIYAGDFSGAGWDIEEAIGFRDWISKQNYSHIIIVPGNHDRMMENIFSSDKQKKEFFEINNKIHYIHNEYINIDGFSFFGTGDQPIFCNWAFNRTPEQLKKSYSLIPENLDFLIAHCPAYGILDCSHVPRPFYKRTGEEHLGSIELQERLSQLKNPPRYFCFGHIHGDGGKMTTIGNTTYINASVCNERYEPINPIITLEIKPKG